MKQNALYTKFGDDNNEIKSKNTYGCNGFNTTTTTTTVGL